MKRKKSNENLNQKKFEHLDMDLEMQRSYESIIFLGTSMFDDLEKFKSDLLGPYHLCMEYFMEKGDYSKVEEIIKLLGMMDGERKVKIDKHLLDTMEINLN